jgi:hypothetical protein
MLAMSILAVMVVPIVFLGCLVLYKTLNHWSAEKKMVVYQLRPFSAKISAATGQTTEGTKAHLEFCAQVKNRAIHFRFQLSDPKSTVKGPLTTENKVLGAEQRADELWKSTCFEVFWQFKDQQYLELNVSPDGRWNLYQFDKYREGMRSFESIEFIQFKTQRLAHHYELVVIMNIPDSILQDGLLNSQISATAVLSNGKENEYWAVLHAGQKPDFHLQESFVIPLKIEL